MKNVLIAGVKSYIGESFNEYISQWPERYSITEISTRGLQPRRSTFENIDVVFCVAGIAHVRETSWNRYLYYEINRDLIISIARAAKEAGVRQFILLSSMSVYGLVEGHITKNTHPHPINDYGKSKLQADESIKKMEDKNFIFCCLRPPMVYGKNCKGNYQALRKFALWSPIFPEYANVRSMIYIGNLCAFVKNCIDFERGGLLFPQNEKYTDTSEMVRLIAQNHGKNIRMSKLFAPLIQRLPFHTVKKVFGNLTLEKVDIVKSYDFEESIRLTEQ